MMHSEGEVAEKGTPSTVLYKSKTKAVGYIVLKVKRNSIKPAPFPPLPRPPPPTDPLFHYFAAPVCFQATRGPLVGLEVFDGPGMPSSVALLRHTYRPLPAPTTQPACPRTGIPPIPQL
ncbi:unnamed protein product [Arctogadus glacialis]